jgi:hypothetical protein
MPIYHKDMADQFFKGENGKAVSILLTELKDKRNEIQ